mmetsp:Transcript_4015/g.7671  ORF Transcript_4015/g.7671 Transcript_4015/m.7671 type:complete len:373 (+) Transcript_4015:3-1121(+)
MLQRVPPPFLPRHRPPHPQRPKPVLRHALHHLDPLLHQLIHRPRRQSHQLRPILLAPVERHDESPILPEARHRNRVRHRVIEHGPQRIQDRTEAIALLAVLLVVHHAPVRRGGKGVRGGHEVGAAGLRDEDSALRSQDAGGASVEFLRVEGDARSGFDGVGDVHYDDVECFGGFHEIFVGVSDDEFHFGVVGHCVSAPFGEVFFTNLNHLRIDIHHNQTLHRIVFQNFPRGGKLPTTPDKHRLRCRSLIIIIVITIPSTENGTPKQRRMDQRFVIHEFVVLGALGLAIGHEGATEKRIDDLHFLEFGEGGVEDGVEGHVDFQARGDVFGVAEGGFGAFLGDQFFVGVGGCHFVVDLVDLVDGDVSVVVAVSC